MAKLASSGVNEARGWGRLGIPSSLCGGNLKLLQRKTVQTAAFAAGCGRVLVLDLPVLRSATCAECSGCERGRRRCVLRSERSKRRADALLGYAIEAP
eukprot:3566554-Pleurochrysis_carterae.AAC.5